jgi:hypothetical protein
MRVRIYRNLSPQYRERRAWSVMAYEGPNKGRIIEIVDGIVLKDVRFVVNEGGRQRVIQEKRKNVHAFVDGTLVKTFAFDTLKKDLDGETLAPSSGARSRVSYDPYRFSTFVREDCGLAPVSEARVVVVAPRGVYAALPPCGRGVAELGEIDVDGWNG